MPPRSPHLLFRIAATGVLVLFITIMIGVTIAAYSRQSGKTGVDMAKMRDLRQNAPLKSDSSSVLSDSFHE